MDKADGQASTEVKAGKRKKRFTFVAEDKKLAELMVKDISGEIILKPSFPRTTRHLSLYPKEGAIGHHVTHERYPKGDNRRHTQKGITDLRTRLNELLKLIASPDDLPLEIQSLECIRSKEDVIPWLERTLKRSVRPPGENLVRIIKEPWGQKIEKLFYPGEEEGIIDLSFLYEIRDQLPKIREHDRFTTIKESELFRMGRRIAFSEDSTQVIYVLNENAVMVLSVDRLSNLSSEIISQFGLDGYLRSLNRDWFGGID